MPDERFDGLRELRQALAAELARARRARQRAEALRTAGGFDGVRDKGTGARLRDVDRPRDGRGELDAEPELHAAE